MTPGIRPLAPYRRLIARCLIGAAMLALLLHAASGLLPAQLLAPVLTNYHYDLTMWLYRLSGLYRVVGQGVSSWIFTGLIFASGAVAFIDPRRRVAAMVFTVLFFLTALHFNYFLTHGSHYLAGFVWLLPVLWLRGDRAFEWGWEGARYYACWAFSCAGIMKLWHGAFWQWNAGERTTRGNLALYLYQNAETGVAHFYYWMLAHPALLNAGHKLVALCECAFLIGFFTKRFDRLLILLMIVIVAAVYLFADVFFAELMVLALPLISLRGWAALQRRLGGRKLSV